MPTKPKQQRADNQAHVKEKVLQSFREWCGLYRKAPTDASIREFTADMDGIFEGVSAAELVAFIRSESR